MLDLPNFLPIHTCLDGYSHTLQWKHLHLLDTQQPKFTEPSTPLRQVFLWFSIHTPAEQNLMQV